MIEHTEVRIPAPNTSINFALRDRVVCKLRKSHIGIRKIAKSNMMPIHAVAYETINKSNRQRSETIWQIDMVPRSLNLQSMFHD